MKIIYRPYQESTLHSTVGQPQWIMPDNVDNTPRMIAGIQQASDVLLDNNRFDQDFFNRHQQQ